MVAGHLQEKNGIYYMVLSYPSANGKRKNKWISTKLPVKGNKKKAEKMLSEIRQTFVLVEKPMDAEINFSDYMLQWLQIVKPTVATTTYASYSSIVQKIVVPYRCLKELAHTAGFPLKSVGGREQVSLSAALSSRPICRIGSKAA